MCNPPPPLSTEAPWGHSASAHRALGWCADCPGRHLDAELLAWRTHENRRHEAEQAAPPASTGRPGTVDLQAFHDRPCPACGVEALTVVTVTLVDGRTRRQVGGWTICNACDAVPTACYCQPGDTAHLAVPVPATEESDRG